MYPWRPYQARILAELDRHMEDRHFHVVAAPGSGKTVLGLETLRRIDRPALVFAPSLGIRDQWIRRFTDLFLQQDKPPDWISTDLKEPGKMTVITYQSLHAAMGREGPEAIVQALRQSGVQTLVFDEAHHLRKAWWDCLMQVKEGLEDLFIVALTATPPYDASQVEWNRYMALCGEIDEEIPVPELVRERNLCPHQDYIYFSIPGEEERRQLQLYGEGVRAAMGDLGLDQELVDLVRTHPLVAHPEAHMGELLADSDYALSLAIYLNHAHGVVPESYRGILGLEDVELPPFTSAWAEVLLNQLLFRDAYVEEHHPVVVKRIREGMGSIGAVHKRRILLKATPVHARLLRSSISKLYSIAEIIELEYTTLRASLRCVVITDYIREDEFPSLEAPDRELTRMGVVPIFEHMRRLRFKGLDLGILSGKVVVLPKKLLPVLQQLLRERGLDPDRLQANPLVHDPAYLRIRLQGSDASRLIGVMTDCFQDGHLQVLIGTTALLGEGWDAPAINCLVMATVVGSYMTSNQLRGRAIRVNPRDPEKTANIWHLACVAPGLDEGETGAPIQAAMTDLPLMERRFKMFVGLSRSADRIQDGLERTGIDAGPKDVHRLEALNQSSCIDACEREEMYRRWMKVLDIEGSVSTTREGRVAREVFVPVTRLTSHPVARNLLRGTGWFSTWMRGWVEKHQAACIARALLECLEAQGYIKPETARPSVRVSLGKDRVYIRVQGLNTREESLFTSALSGLFNPLSKPRYLLVSKNAVYPVPERLGLNKAGATSLHLYWRRRVERADLVYTHTAEGRVHLLRARQKYLAGKYRDDVTTRKVWA